MMLLRRLALAFFLSAFAGLSQEEVEKPVIEAEEPVIEAEEPVTEAEEPVTEVEEPVIEVEEPVIGAEEPLIELEEAVNEAEEPVIESVRSNMWDFLTQVEESGLEMKTNPETRIRIEEGELDTVLALDGGGNIKHQGVDLYAESFRVSVATQDVHLDGNVRIYRDELVFKGDSAIYNYADGRVTANNLRSGQDPVLFRAGSFRSKFDLEAKTADFFEAESALVTTHDLERPNYRIEAGRVKILPPPDNRIEMHDVKIFMGDRQVFWFPYLAKSVDEELGWYFRPGFDSNWGAYLLSEYGFRWEEHTLVKVQVDGRSRRGLAGGVELHSQKFKDNDNIGQFKAYYANDLDPNISRTTKSRRDGNEDRYRFSLQHRVYVPGPEDSDLYVDIDVNVLSDEFVYEDFFPSEFKTDPNPENMINIVKTDPRGTLSTMARFNGNDFFRSDERLPEVALDITRQSVFGSDLFYEGSTSIGAYREPLSSREREFLRGDGGSLEEFFGVPESAIDPSELNSLLNDLEAQVDGYSFKRFDTFHQFSLPFVNERGFSLVPRVGARYTNYFDIDSGDPDIDSTESRTLLHAGIEGAFKFSREYPDVRSERWGLNELRHIVQPYFNYSFLAGNDLSGDVPRIDRLTPSTQLRPIDISKYTATDDLSPWNILRLGVRNVLQTKRDGQTHNWLQLNTYVDTFLEDPEASRTHSNLFNELLWHPLPWLKLEMDSQLPIFADDQDFVEVNTRMRYMPTKNTEFILSHRFLSDHPFFGDSNLLNFRFYARLNENWGIGTYHRYELDDNTLELQQYSIHRDLGSWTAALGGLARDHRGEREYGVVFALSLNDVPRVRLPLSIDPNPSGR